MELSSGASCENEAIKREEGGNERKLAGEEEGAGW